MLQGLRTVGFHVRDLEAARDWYSRVLGFEPYFDQPFYVGFAAGGYELGLMPAEEGRGPGAGGDTAYWEVGDPDRAVARLVELGATVEEAPRDVGDGIRTASVIDPFGNRLGLIRNPHFRAGAGAQVVASGAELSDRAVVHERVVARPRGEVWRLWTTEEGLKEWLLQDCRVELRVGGPYEFYFMPDGPEGFRGGEGCVVLSFLPQRLLSFTWNAPPHLSTREQHTWVVLELEDAGEGTRVRLTHTGWPAAGLGDPESDWAATFAYFEAAWARVLDAL